ncbi:hypothetical protein F4V91_31970 [Neorhizobium galegae]|uniref:Uncharacterized protein n=1 Tax=Neorhizobium galegae TaxID=399 RepID=A0A6A1TH55_NEOGA|nr:hypothetical protein [Neorhizobium galegae]KAB1082571.1 hypothetical protein F4V91_31970 [Neorhizobium galegae]
MSKSPIVGKSSSFPFQVAIACWIDLLGYGRMIADAGFNPLHLNAKKAITRIRRFHQTVAEHSAHHFPTLVMNDGAVAYRDLSMRSRSVTHDFLTRSWRLFEAIKAEDQKLGHPGARLVLSCGFRMRGRRAGLDASRSHFESIITRLQDGAIDAQQAVHEAAAMRPRFDIVPQLQANFAFTKAYVAESSGTGGGLPGPNFYLDLILFGHSRPQWLELGPAIEWACPRLKLEAKFASVQAIPKLAYPAGGPIDILDGHGIARLLANDPDVLMALHTAGKT